MAAISAIEQKLDIHPIDAVVQLGDFSLFWDKDGFVTALESLLDKYSVDGYFLDGNHDAWDVLCAMNFVGQTTPQPFSERLFYLPRGVRWEWDGIQFAALGGGASIDWGMRESGINWFPDEEIIAQRDFDRLVSGGPVDILLTHDGPNTERMEQRLRKYRSANRYTIDDATEQLCKTQRNFISAAIDKTEPICLFHGHHHYAYATVYVGPRVYTNVFGLAADGHTRSFRILDTKDVSNLKKGWQRGIKVED